VKTLRSAAGSAHRRGRLLLVTDDPLRDPSERVSPRAVRYWTARALALWVVIIALQVVWLLVRPEIDARMVANPRLTSAERKAASSALTVAASRLPRHPVVTGTAAMLWGYFSSAARRAPRYDDPEFRRFVRRYQHLALLVGKRAATRKVVAERAGDWKARHPGLTAGAAHA